MSANIVVPEMGESVVEATVVRWLKEEGDPVSVGEAVVELETEKANFEVGAEAEGVLARIEKKETEDVVVGDVLGIIEASDKKEQKVKIDQEIIRKTHNEIVEQQSEHPIKERESLRVVRDEERVTDTLITPVARRIAEEKNVDLSLIRGTGSRNRITKEDIQNFLVKQNTEPKTTQILQKDEQVVRDKEPIYYSEGPGRKEERVRMSRRRRTIARRMLEAQRTAAILTTFNEVDMSSVMDLRKRRKDSFKERYGVGIGIVSFFVKASIGALKEFPLLNAEIQGDEIVHKSFYDIGVAIGASGGLVVPILRDAEKMSFADIERSISEFATKAEEETLTLDDLRGGTFTISNGGVFGSLMSTPILNPPQVAILGLHKIEERPIVANHEIVIRPMMYLALSYDHRIVDGREAVLFLVRIKTLIEDPGALLLEG
ncbi:2-oxoglutarate dehydrogenase complex dihydrolipoyllysine-residue succinyltransferase [Desulfobacterota bacterium AH_259_B03_O07]|nr:2-oxoglutarate dehydrogenase complex dihydrolipoyllysine-residue succinyltransferase [Desulfobacterota bacterium AH_259_B03_O07]